MVFTLAQHFLSEALSGRNEALNRLNLQIAELGENISIRRFSRFQVGEGLEHEEKNLAEEVQQQIASA